MNAQWFNKLGFSDVLVQDLQDKKSWKIKMGFDPTGAQLHFGHAVGLLALRRLQDLGHQVVVVVGEFTALIGDPTGKKRSPSETE